MKISRSVQYGFMGLALLVAFAAGNGAMDTYLETTPAVKEAKAVISLPRPDFVLPDLNGKLQNINQWDGQVVVLNFWASWCEPCRKEMPAFLELQEKYASEGLQFVGIALESAKKAKDFAAKLGVNYPNLAGGEEALKVSSAYGNRLGALPYTAVIARDGMIVSTYRGEVSKNDLEEVVRRHL